MPVMEATALNEEYLKKACEQIESKDILVNLAARRAKELARGAHPLLPIDRAERTNYLNVALREIAEGKITFEVEDDEE